MIQWAMPYKDPEAQKAAQRRWYEDNKALTLERSRSRRNSVVQYIQKIKNETPCQDCKVNYPYYMMDFDHVRGEKLFTISAKGTIPSMTKLLAEIDKCDIVCSNCHRHRTWIRLLKSGSDTLEFDVEEMVG
jgi:hypothetical protein